MLLRFALLPARPRSGRAVSRLFWLGVASSFTPIVVAEAQNATSTGPESALKRPQLTLSSPPQSAIALHRRAASVAANQKFRQLLISLPGTAEKSNDVAATEATRPPALMAGGNVGPGFIAPIAADNPKISANRRVETWGAAGGRENPSLPTALATVPVAPVPPTNGEEGTSTRMARASLSVRPGSLRPGAAQLPSRGGGVPKSKGIEVRSDGAAPAEATNGSVADAVSSAAREVKEVKPREMPAVSASERLMLARLDADLGRAQSRLNRAESRLSEGQKQLGSFTDVLRDAMLDAGDDAHGLHPFVRVAQRYLGTPYVWGGESARGFDCSGFIMRVMRDLGYRALPHSAAEQFRYGLPVAKPLLKAGDVVFFANTYKPGISHVGIYLGRGRFIHAANSRVGTIVSSLNEPKWVEKYAGARRLLPVNS